MQRDLLIVGALMAVLFLAALGARDLWNPNEPVYGAAVQEMAEEGRWLLPQVNGRVFPEKPILYFWLARVAAKLTGGTHELALRLPSALAAWLAGIGLYLLVLPYLGAPRARLTVLLYATTYVVWWSARQVQMDVMVMASTVGVVLALTRLLDHGASARKAFALAGLCVGLGVLAKGPVALVCAGIPVVCYAAATSRLRGLLGGPALIGAAAAAVVAVPWFAAVAAQGHGDVLREMLVRQNVGRYLDAWDHQAPWWYYLKYFWIDLAPWSWFVPLAFGLKLDPAEGKLHKLAWLWLAGTILFFSLSDSKRSVYLLPAAPAAAILAASVGQRLLERGLTRLRRNVALALCVAFAFVGVVVGSLLLKRPLHADVVGLARAFALFLIVGGGTVLTGLFWRRRGAVAVPTALFAFVLVALLFAGAAVLPAADRFKSARGFSTKVAALVGDASLTSYRFWHWRAEYRYYLGRRHDNVNSRDKLARYWGRPERVAVIAEDELIEEAYEVVGVEPVLEETIGSRKVGLFLKEKAPPEGGALRTSAR